MGKVPSVTRYKWVAASLVLTVIVIPVLLVAWVPAYREEHLVTVTGKLSQASPVDYIRSKQFVTKAHQLKIVLTMRANQQIIATIEVARIIGFYIRGGTGFVRIFGLYPEMFINRTQWNFHYDYTRTSFVSLEKVPAKLLGRVPLGLEIEIFLEAPAFGTNPTFLIFWEITVYGAY